MHTLTVQVDDSVMETVLSFLKKISPQKVSVISDIYADSSDINETIMLSNHSANLIEDWHDESEDEIWK